MEKALRYNEGKLRYDLIPLHSLKRFINAKNDYDVEDLISLYQQGKDTINGLSILDCVGYQLFRKVIAEEEMTSSVMSLPTRLLNPIAAVFTMGSKKYAAFNWAKGASWQETLGSLLRHYRAFLIGIELDDESGQPHIAHAIVNAIFLQQFYHLAPFYDDRLKNETRVPKIILDVDDVVADFLGAYKTHFNITRSIQQWNFSYKTSEHLINLEKNKDFWVNMPVLHKPNFIPVAYVSSREIPVEWTEEFIEKNNLPCCPVYHVGYKESKTQLLTELDCQLFIDDKVSNVISAQKANICSFLMDNDHNKGIDVGYRRIFNLDISTIIHT